MLTLHYTSLKHNPVCSSVNRSAWHFFFCKRAKFQNCTCSSLQSLKRLYIWSYIPNLSLIGRLDNVSFTAYNMLSTFSELVCWFYLSWYFKLAQKLTIKIKTWKFCKPWVNLYQLSMLVCFLKTVLHRHSSINMCHLNMKAPYTCYYFFCPGGLQEIHPCHPCYLSSTLW